MSAGNSGQISGNGLPLLPTTSSWNIHSSKQLSTNAIDTDLDLSTTQATGYTCCEGARNLIAEMNVLQLDIVAIVDICYIDTYLIVLFCLHAL